LCSSSCSRPTSETSSARLSDHPFIRLDDDIKAPVRIGWRRWLAVGLLFCVTLVAARTCQQSQVRLTKEQAMATARKQVDFQPRQTQVRLVRQGINSRPYWAVSLSIPTGVGEYSRLTTVRVDANTGKVAAVNREIAP
jgi:hypothetical protein